MVSSPLVSTLLFLALATTTQATSIHVNRALNHRGLSERIVPRAEIEIQPQPRKMNRRRTCKAPISSGAAAVAQSSTSTGLASGSTATEAAGTTASKAVEAVSKPAAESPTTEAATKTTATTAKTGTTTQKAATTTTGSKATSTASTSSSGGHQFTLTNKCSAAVHPVVVSTACGYSPRCADASTAALPSVGSLAAGHTTVINVPDNFVGRIFSQDGSCGSSGEDCTMLEFNLDADSFYTPNSYDISNIQGFTQSISLGADGCDTVTCTDANCSCENAYPIGDETGCGADLPVKACGAGNIGFNVVFCP